MPISLSCRDVLTPATLALTLALGAKMSTTHASAQGAPAIGPGQVNVHDFADQVVGGDWSPAIQAAIDHVDQANGFTRGGVVYFPPGDYRIDRTLILGRNRAQWGLQMLGHGATLIGSKKLDAQARDWGKLAEGLEGNKLIAFEADNGLGPAILEVRKPPDETEFDGSGYVIDGLTFNREVKRNGIGIQIAAPEVPKGMTLRNVRVFNQDIGMHVNYAWQIYFNNCTFSKNRVGVLGQNHFNAVSFINCMFRLNIDHGLQIGPNSRSSWGCSNINITGCIFEANRKYGIYNAAGVQVVVTGCYFEANGISVGIESSFGHTTIDTCHFWNFWKGDRPKIPHFGKAHVLLKETRDVQLRNNRYGKGDPILLSGRLSGNLNRFDADPVLAVGVRLAEGFQVASDDGMSLYEYRPSSRDFIRKPLTANEKDVAPRDQEVEQVGE